MTIDEVLQNLRDCDYVECKDWADAIEAAMREQVAEVRHANGTTFCVFDPDLSHGTKLYALPPDAQAELLSLTEQLAERDAEIERLQEDKERLRDRIDGWHQSIREKDAEIERLLGHLSAVAAEAALAGKEDRT